MITCCLNDIEFSGKINEKLPSCTRRDFPSKIEDCLDNARDLFDNYFIEPIEDLISIILNKKKNFNQIEFDDIDKYRIINEYLYILTLKEIKKIEEEKIEQELVYFGLNEFKKLFIDNIKNIYKHHPIDEKIEDKLFWSGTKRPPKETEFDINDEFCVTFLYNFILISANLLMINFKDNYLSFKEKANKILLKGDNNSNSSIIFNKINDKKILYENILNFKDIITNNKILLNIINNISPVQFEKDKPELGHLKFIHSYTNLKARSYNIPNCDEFYTLEYVGKIAPTTITSTAVVAGFMCLQIIGILISKTYGLPNNTLDKDKNAINNDDDEEEDFEEPSSLVNFTFDLRCNTYIISELPKVVLSGEWKVNKNLPKKFSRWDKIEVKGSRTVKDFIDYIKEKYEIDVTLILSAEDNSDIFAKKFVKFLTKKARKEKELLEKKLNQTIEDIYYSISEKNCKKFERSKIIFLRVSGLDKNDSYVALPIIKYII